jgi:hypothetical protein
VQRKTAGRPTYASAGLRGGFSSGGVYRQPGVGLLTPKDVRMRHQDGDEDATDAGLDCYVCRSSINNFTHSLGSPLQGDPHFELANGAL